MNKVTLIGNITRDIEVKSTNSGFLIAKIGLAVNRRFKKQDGTQGDEVMYIDVKVFGNLASVCQQYLAKGRKIAISGRLVLEQWQDSTGAKHSKHTIAADEVEFLGDNQGQGQGGQGYQSQAPKQAPSQPQQQQQSQAQQAQGESFDDIPF